MFGAFGSGGVILVIIAALIAHKRGGGKLKVVQDHHIVWWGVALGLVASTAGTAFQQLGTVSQTISSAFHGQSGNVGTVGAPAIALVVLIVAFGFRPRMLKDLVCGVALPGLLSAAGGLWALPMTVMASLLHSMVG